MNEITAGDIIRFDNLEDLIATALELYRLGHTVVMLQRWNNERGLFLAVAE